MCRDRIFRSQRGAGLPVALFVITVLALIVAGMSQLQQSAGQAVSLQIQSQRAFFAAESGAQVGVGRILHDPTNPQCFTGTINFSNSGLSDCRVDIACTATAGDEVLTLKSAASCGSGADAASRTVEVRVR